MRTQRGTLTPAAVGDGCYRGASVDDEEDEVARRLCGPGGRGLRQSQTYMPRESATPHTIERQQGAGPRAPFGLHIQGSDG